MVQIIKSLHYPKDIHQLWLDLNDKRLKIWIPNKGWEPISGATQEQLDEVIQKLDSIISGGDFPNISTLEEIKAFLHGVSKDQTLLDMLNAIQDSIDDVSESKVSKVDGKSLIDDLLIQKLDELYTRQQIDDTIADVREIGTGAQESSNKNKASIIQIKEDIRDNKLTVDSYTVNGKQISSNPTITKQDIGLGNVDNTTDLNKPVSTATSQRISNEINGLTLRWDSAGTQIQLLDKDNIVISTIDASDFIKDGMIESVDIVDDSIVIVFNVDAGSKVLNLPLNKLVNIYDGHNSVYLDKTNRLIKLVISPQDDGYLLDTPQGLRFDDTSIQRQIEQLGENISDIESSQIGTDKIVDNSITYQKTNFFGICLDTEIDSIDKTGVYMYKTIFGDSSYWFLLTNWMIDKANKRQVKFNPNLGIFQVRKGNASSWEDWEDITIGGNSIKDKSIQNSKLSNMAANTIKGSVSGGTPSDLSTSQVRLMLNINNVNNTSDADKPVSTATQSALNGKVDKVSGKSLISESLISKLQDLYTREQLDNELQSIVDTIPEDSLYYGISISPGQADPHLTRVGNSEMHRKLPIQSKYRGCIYRPLTKTFMYWLDEDDWRYKKGGNPNKGEVEQLSRLDGYDGEVMIFVPGYYIKSIDSEDEQIVMMSPVKIDDTWYYNKPCYVGAYRDTLLREVPANMGYLSTLPQNSAISVANTSTYCRGGTDNTSNDQYLQTEVGKTHLGKCSTSTNRINARSYVRKAGKELISYRQYLNIFYWPYVIEYSNLNSQEAFNSALTELGYRQGGLGSGVTTLSEEQTVAYNNYVPITPCGYCNDLGNNTGIKDLTININSSTQHTFHVPRWRGFDNVFGDTWTMVDGVLVDPNSNQEGRNGMDLVYTTDNPSYYSDTSFENMKLEGTKLHAIGWIKGIYVGNNASYRTALVGSSATTYFCDYTWAGDSNSTLRTLLFSGRASSGVMAGLGFLYSSLAPSYSSPSVGFRSICVP